MNRIVHYLLICSALQGVLHIPVHAMERTRPAFKKHQTLQSIADGEYTREAASEVPATQDSPALVSPASQTLVREETAAALQAPAAEEAVSSQVSGEVSGSDPEPQAEESSTLESSAHESRTQALAAQASQAQEAPLSAEEYYSLRERLPALFALKAKGASLLQSWLGQARNALTGPRTVQAANTALTTANQARHIAQRAAGDAISYARENPRAAATTALGAASLAWTAAHMASNPFGIVSTAVVAYLNRDKLEPIARQGVAVASDTFAATVGTRMMEDVVNPTINDAQERVDDALGKVKKEGRKIEKKLVRHSENLGKTLKEEKKSLIKRAKKFGRGIKEDFKEGTNEVVLKAVGGTLLAIGAFFLAKWAATELERHYNRPVLEFKHTPTVTKPVTRDGFYKKDPFAYLVYQKEAQERLSAILNSTAHINRQIAEGDTNGAYRGLLLCGPKNCGKHAFARSLADYIGMDFVELEAHTFTKYKDENQMRAAFENFFNEIVGKSSKGTVLFVDNAEALVREQARFDKSRRKADTINNTPLGRALSAFIGHVESRNKRIMVILSAQTEEAMALSAGLASIIQDIVEVPRPGLQERARIITLYRNVLFSGETVSDECAESALKELSIEKIARMAEQLDGVSAKDLYLGVQSIKRAAQSSNDGKVSQPVIDKAVQEIVEAVQKRKKD